MNNQYTAVIVTYNPTSDDLDSLNDFVAQFNHIIIVDNGSNNSLEVKKLTSNKCVVVLNNENKGLAYALNQGCRHAIAIGYKYCLLLDQDSVISEQSIDKLIQIHEKLGKKCGIASPKIYLKSGGNLVESNYLVKSGIGFKKMKVKDSPLEVLINITSGSMINLNIWNEVGGFRDDFFIEGIDDEYALRLNSLGYKVVVSNEASLIQQYGNMTENNVMGKAIYTTNHNAVRRTYCYRNKIVIMKQYFFKENAYVVFQFLSLLRKLMIIMLFEADKNIKLKGIIKGISLGLHNKMGKIETSVS